MTSAAADRAAAAAAALAGLTALTFANAHTHHRNVPDYPYMNYRVKDFPW